MQTKKPNYSTEHNCSLLLGRMPRFFLIPNIFTIKPHRNCCVCFFLGVCIVFALFSFFFSHHLDEYSYADFFLLVSFYVLVNVLFSSAHSKFRFNALLLSSVLLLCFFLSSYSVVSFLCSLFALSYLSKNNNDVYHYWILPVAKVARPQKQAMKKHKNHQQHPNGVGWGKWHRIKNNKTEQ